MHSVALVLACVACAAHSRSTGQGDLEVLASLLRASNAFNPSSLGAHPPVPESEDFHWAQVRQPLSHGHAEPADSATDAQPAENFGWAKKRQALSSPAGTRSGENAQPAGDFGWAAGRQPLRDPPRVARAGEPMAAVSPVFTDIVYANANAAEVNEFMDYRAGSAPPAEMRKKQKAAVPTAAIGALAVAAAASAFFMQDPALLADLSDKVADLIAKISP
mmetsp:Transcript_120257/g.208759  ORF Transcript_120257/g.208759 Transcript_120257/m.208759 type:complete len:219 (+) Transcript_120257:88-744(+)